MTYFSLTPFSERRSSGVVGAAALVVVDSHVRAGGANLLLVRHCRFAEIQNYRILFFVIFSISLSNSFVYTWLIWSVWETAGVRDS